MRARRVWTPLLSEVVGTASSAHQSSNHHSLSTLEMAPAAKQQRTQQQYRSGTDNKPYRRGVTLGKAMRRGKLAQGPPPTSSARGKPVEGAVKGGATKGKGTAPAPLQVDSASEEGDEEMGEDEEGDVQGSEGDDDSEGEGAGLVQRAAPVAASGKRRVPRKAGGAGKKQKTFVEEKVRRLALPWFCSAALFPRG